MIFIGYTLQSFEYIAYEYISIHYNNKYSSNLIIGLIGINGVFYVIAILLPLLYFMPGSDYNNSLENIVDTFYMLNNNNYIIIMSILLIISSYI